MLKVGVVSVHARSTMVWRAISHLTRKKMYAEAEETPAFKYVLMQ